MPRLPTHLLDSPRFPPLFLAALVLALFAPALFSGPNTVISAPYGDVFSQFLGWREYGFSRLASGDIPLWNPHTFSGQPFLGNWQTALFYPPNWLHLFLPAPFTITLLVALHIYLAGLFCSCWLRYRGYSPFASALAGATFMLSAPIIGRVFPGHLTWIAVVAWSPLVFLALDRLLDSGRLRHALLGSTAVALMILAGYPQPVYITLLAATTYLILNLLASPHRRNACLGFAIMLLFGTALAAIQALPGLETGLSSSRAGGTSFAYATSYALPPQNLLTLIAPLALGGPSTSTYAGPGFLWECWPYIGTVALLTALLGALTDHQPNAPRRRWSLTLSLLFLLLALGPSTPLYHYAYTALPGLSSFRAPGRFLLIPALFLTPLLAAGIEYLRSQKLSSLPRLLLIILPLASAAALITLAQISGAGAKGPLYPTPLYASAIFLTLTSAAFALHSHWKLAPHFLLLLAATETLFVASRSVATGPATPTLSPAHRASLASIPENTRLQIQDISLANLPLRNTRLHGLSGYDPLQQKRLTEFLAASQGEDPRLIDEIVGPLLSHPSWRLLRASTLLAPNGQVIPLNSTPLPHALLVDRVELSPLPALRLARLMSPDFDPTKTLLLEQPPAWPQRESDPDPSETDPTQPAYARVTSDTGDTLTIEVLTPRLTHLLLTDAYAPGWTATRSDTNESLPVLPANHILRAIPLTPPAPPTTPGPPRPYTVTLTYLPPGYLYGRWISLLSLLVLLTWALLTLRRPRLPRLTSPKPSHKSPPAHPHTDSTTTSSDSAPATSPPSPPPASDP